MIQILSELRLPVENASQLCTTTPLGRVGQSGQQLAPRWRLPLAPSAHDCHKCRISYDDGRIPDRDILDDYLHAAGCDGGFRNSTHSPGKQIDANGIRHATGRDRHGGPEAFKGLAGLTAVVPQGHSVSALEGMKEREGRQRFTG